jgi:hypothetical protein
MSQAIKETNIGYAALGPAIPELPEGYMVIPDALVASQNVFFSGFIADGKLGISAMRLKPVRVSLSKLRCSTQTASPT